MLVASRPSSRHASTKLARAGRRGGSCPFRRSRGSFLGHDGEDGLHGRARGIRGAADPKGGQIERGPPGLAAKGPLHGAIDRGDVDVLEGPRGTAPRLFGPRRAARSVPFEDRHRLPVQAGARRPPARRVAAPGLSSGPPFLAKIYALVLAQKHDAFCLHCLKSVPTESCVPAVRRLQIVDTEGGHDLDCGMISSILRTRSHWGSLRRVPHRSCWRSSSQWASPSPRWALAPVRRAPTPSLPASSAELRHRPTPATHFPAESR